MSECYLDLEVVNSMLFGSSGVSAFRSAFAEWTVQVALQPFLCSILQISLILSVLANSRYHEPESWAFFKWGEALKGL
jgi:hypothetical protein